MSSTCVRDARVPSSASYVRLNKLPEYCDNAKLSGTTGRKQVYGWNPMHARATTCRGRSRRRQQVLYLRNVKAYSFSRKETASIAVPVSGDEKKKTRRSYFGKVTGSRQTLTRPFRSRRRKTTSRVVLVKKVKEFSCEAFCSVFQKLLSCTATVDVVEQNNDHHIIRQNNQN